MDLLDQITSAIVDDNLNAAPSALARDHSRALLCQMSSIHYGDKLKCVVHLSDVCALGLDIHRVERLTCRNEESIAFCAAETDVASSFRQDDLSDALTVGCEDVNSVETCSTPTSTGPEVPININTQSVRTTYQLFIICL